MQMWAEPKDGFVLILLTPDELEKLPNGSVLYRLNGSIVTKGSTKIDTDTRFGHLAYGLKVEVVA